MDSQTGAIYSWEEDFIRSIEKIPGCKLDRGWANAKYLPKKQREKEWARLKQEEIAKQKEQTI